MSELKPITLKEWSTELRSGKWKQTTETLCRAVQDEIHYCCLGVLCKLVGLKEEFNAQQMDKGFFITETGILPQEVASHMNIDRKGALLSVQNRDGYTYHNLAELNDAGLSFSEIADFIDSGMVYITKEEVNEEKQIDAPAEN